jgi:hypothetical protein
VVLSDFLFAGVDDRPQLPAGFPLSADLVVLLCTQLLPIRDAVALLSTCASLRRHAARPALWFALLQRDYPFVLRVEKTLRKVREVMTARMQIFVSPPIEQAQFWDAYAKVHSFLRQLGRPPFVPVLAVLRVVSPNTVPRQLYRGIVQLCEGAPFEVQRGDSVTPQLWCMSSSDATPYDVYYSCCLAQRWTFPLLSRVAGFFGREQPLVAKGGSGVQVMLGGNPLRAIQHCGVVRRNGFDIQLRPWIAIAAGWTKVSFFISREQLALDSPPGQCVTFPGRRPVQPFFDFFIHFREK